MHVFSLKHTAITLAIGLGVSTRALAFPAAASMVPEDFNGLMEGQTEFLDVTVLGEPLGIFAVTVRPDTVTFDEPGAVVDALQAAGALIDDPTRAILLETFASRMATHESLDCSSGMRPCGYLDTESSGVILNRQEATLALFLRSEWFPRKAPDDRFHAVSAGSERAFLHRQNMLYASGRGFSSFALTGSGVQGLRDGAWFAFDWRVTQQNARGTRTTRWQLANANVRQDLGSTHYVQAGRMDMRNLSSTLGGTFNIGMQPFQQLEGVRIGTTQAYVNASAVGKGTPLMVILTQPSRVDMYRHDELIGTAYLQAGAQAIDTSTFPIGNYPVTLRIVENGSVARTETLPFSRAGGMAANLSGPQWFVQSGQAVITDAGETGLRTVRKPALQGGVRMPLGRGLALGHTVSQLDGTSYFEARLDAWFALGGRSLATSWAQMRGSDGASGAVQQLTLSGRVSWSLYRYRTRAKGCSDATSLVRRGMGCSQSTSLSANTAVAGGQFTVGLMRADARTVPGDPFQAPGDPLRPGARLPLESASRSLFASYNRMYTTAGGALASLGVNGYRRTYSGGTSDVGGFVSLTFTRVPSLPAAGPSRVRSMGVQTTAVRGSKASTQLRFAQNTIWRDHGYRELSMQASAEHDRFNALVMGRYEGPLGRLNANVGHDHVRGQRRSSSLSASYASAFALSRSGLSLGPDAGGTDPMAGVIVDVSGGEPSQRGAAATVHSPAISAQILSYGQRRLLPLNPFRQERVDTRDAHTSERSGPGSVTVETGLGIRQWFLAPGHVVRHAIGSRTTYTYTGRLALPGAAARPRLLNALSADLDESGGFVAEFDHRPDVFYAWQRGSAYACQGAAPQVDHSILRAGLLACEEVPLTALPEMARSRLPANALSAHTPAPAAPGRSP